MRDRFMGAMLGLACGDALGAPLEFKTPSDAKARYGTLRDMVGGGPWLPGEWTDDTGMALCVAEGILEDPAHPVVPIGERFLAWKPAAKDVGGTISAALGLYKLKKDWVEASRGTPQAMQGKAAGNGSLMRTLPVALVYADAGRMLRRSARISAMTHWDAQAETCCAIYCLWIRAVLQGADLQDGWQAALSLAKERAAAGNTATPTTPGPVSVSDKLWARLEKVDALAYKDLQPSGYAGYAVECLEAAAWCVLHGANLEESLVQAVNLAGEADTIGAVAGGIAGAFWGVDSIPSRWLGILYERERLEATAHKLADLRHQQVYSEDRLIGKSFEFSKIGDGIIAGRHPLTMLDIEDLASLGVTHILDLREESEWNTPGFHGLEALQAAQRIGITRLNVPIRDRFAPTSDDFDAAWNALSAWRQESNAVVYVHCRAGWERTGAILTACYARKQGLTYRVALQILQTSRSCLSPNAFQAQAAREWLAKHSDG